MAAENEEKTENEEALSGEEAAISRAALLISHYFLSPMSAMFKALLDALSYTTSETNHEHVTVATTCFMDTDSYDEAVKLLDKNNDKDATASRFLALLSDKDAFNRAIIDFAKGTMKDSDMPIVYGASILRNSVSTTCT